MFYPIVLLHMYVSSVTYITPTVDRRIVPLVTTRSLPQVPALVGEDVADHLDANKPPLMNVTPIVLMQRDYPSLPFFIMLSPLSQLFPEPARSIRTHCRCLKGTREFMPMPLLSLLSERHSRVHTNDKDSRVHAYSRVHTNDEDSRVHENGTREFIPMTRTREFMTTREFMPMTRTREFMTTREFMPMPLPEWHSRVHAIGTRECCKDTHEFMENPRVQNNSQVQYLPQNRGFTK